ncbi:MAG: DUF362 domain-containing protein [Bacteroidota bacterium]|nr:DUF362 domain-containing protein [Bacteroidota bacterium]
MRQNQKVYLLAMQEYNNQLISQNLPTTIFACIKPTDTVLLKPNWVKEGHIHKLEDWDYLITHPEVITAVIKRVIEKLGSGGKIIITDGPQTDSSFSKILKHYPIDLWEALTKEKNIDLEILDLRDNEWINEENVIVERKNLDGDPKGKTEVNLLDDASEFYLHEKSKRGYYGADYNIKETNKAHDGHNNLYSVSRTVIEADVFINLPKLKTHKKAGITCCLKNLVGINTYKNYLPHHSEGGPKHRGDQYSCENKNSKFEGPLVAFLKQHILKRPFFARLLKPFVKVGTNVFGKTDNTIRSGNWYGNDTVWRMILDLNKVFFYANPEGSLRGNNWVNAKNYIGIVDAIIAGEGNGPMAPDPVKMGYIICGTNPVAIDAVCCKLMGFNYLKIPSICKAFDIKKYPITPFSINDIDIEFENEKYNYFDIPKELIKTVEPHFGWKNHIELDK